VWIDEWDALQHPVAAAFLAVVYSDYMLTSRTSEVSCSGQSFSPTDLRKFASSQVIFPFPFFFPLSLFCSLNLSSIL
jgi:hypothetical protein